ncbi:MAG: SpoIIE family protein phosphatase [Microcoleus sp. SIO2G3]|nr:SpoIIE family protein phosphatase [Microcoleus sp. SIO2G3]
MIPFGQRNTPLILIADDDRFTRLMLRQILENEGYKVEEVSDGEQCLAAYMKYRPDMVLLDAIMPVMDGFACCIQLQTLILDDASLSDDRSSETATLPRTPVLMITGLNDQMSVDRAFEAGATDYVTKPIHPPVLRQRLRRLLKASWAEMALRESEKKYRSVVENLKEVIFQTDTARRLTFLNPAWSEISGFSLEESLGRCLWDFIHPDDRQLHEEQFYPLLEHQKKHCHYEIRYLSKNGGVAHIEVKARLMWTLGGALVGISGTLNDITERKRQEQYSSAEHAITRTLAESGTLSEATPKILQALCERLGWVLAELWSVDTSANVLRCVETWHLPSVEVSAFEAETLKITLPLGVGLPGCVWASSEPMWMSNLAEATNFYRSVIAAKAGLHTACGFPILSGDEKLGVITFFNHEIQQPDPDLLKLMAVISAQIGQFIKRKHAEEEVQHQNQILQSELNQAAEYVRSLLPLPLSGTVTTQAQFVPSTQLGGDAFDYYWLDADHLVVYLLDVAGHGVKSALLSVSVLNILRSQSLPNTNFYQPSAVLASLNNVFQMSENGDDYFTIWYGVYNQRQHHLVYASAGHPPAVLLSGASTTSPVKQLGARSIPIGMLSDADFDDESYEIQPNSTLYIFSDGVYEIHQPDNKIWGLNAFIKVLTDYKHSNTSNLDKVLHQIQHLNANNVLDDDFSLLQIDFNRNSDSS